MLHSRIINRLGFAAAGLLALVWLLPAVAAWHTAPRPLRVYFSGNLEGEIEPCGCQIPKGGLARRAGFFAETAADSVIPVRVDAGNFAPPGVMRADSLKLELLMDFFRHSGYDAVTLASREMSFGLEIWRTLEKRHAPVLAANLFADAKMNKPLFGGWKEKNRRSNGQVMIRQERGGRVGLIGFVSDAAWRARRDTAAAVTFRSPWDCGELVRKARGQCDVLLLSGEFSRQEAESLAAAFPETDLIITSGVRADQLWHHGRTAIVGVPSRGYVANYLQWDPLLADSLHPLLNKSQVLDSTVRSDAEWARKVSQTKLRADAAIPSP
jgi:2',3'-cyclic-nucleotide 2'-phosphodiesterase (5'-nucleotidase family)